MPIRQPIKKLLAAALPSQWIFWAGRPGQVSLTFDDGPDPRHTPRLLDVLEAHEVKATFCLTGRNVLRHPELVSRIDAGGHDIVNHGYSHLDAKKVGFGAYRQDLEDGFRCLRDRLRRDVRLYRPPYGSTTPLMLLYCVAMKYPVVLWDLDSMDWKRVSVEAIRQAVTRGNSWSGHVMLFHDNNEHTLRFMPELIVAGKRAGCAFSTVSQAMQGGNDVLAVSLADYREKRMEANDGQQLTGRACRPAGVARG